jgi:hypothetical protein
VVDRLLGEDVWNPYWALPDVTDGKDIAKKSPSCLPRIEEGLGSAGSGNDRL